MHWNLSRFIRAILVLQVLLLNLIKFQKNATTTRAVGESRAKLVSLKKICHFTVSAAVRMSPLDVFHFLANNCTTKIYCILRANKYEREVWSFAFRLR